MAELLPKLDSCNNAENECQLLIRLGYIEPDEEQPEDPAVEESP